MWGPDGRPSSAAHPPVQARAVSSLEQTNQLGVGDGWEHTRVRVSTRMCVCVCVRTYVCEHEDV